MEGESMSDKQLQPEIIVFAGPNGSCKSTITKLSVFSRKEKTNTLNGPMSIGVKNRYRY